LRAASGGCGGRGPVSSLTKFISGGGAFGQLDLRGDLTSGIALCMQGLFYLGVMVHHWLHRRQVISVPVLATGMRPRVREARVDDHLGWVINAGRQEGNHSEPHHRWSPLGEAAHLLARFDRRVDAAVYDKCRQCQRCNQLENCGVRRTARYVLGRCVGQVVLFVHMVAYVAAHYIHNTGGSS
jgi:hypothetical protein